MKTANFMIVDWAGNRMFPTKTFPTFEAGWEFVYANIDNSEFEKTENENDNNYQDIFVVPVN